MTPQTWRRSYIQLRGVGKARRCEQTGPPALRFCLPRSRSARGALNAAASAVDLSIRLTSWVPRSFARLARSQEQGRCISPPLEQRRCCRNLSPLLNRNAQGYWWEFRTTTTLSLHRCREAATAAVAESGNRPRWPLPMQQF